MTKTQIRAAVLASAIAVGATIAWAMPADSAPDRTVGLAQRINAAGEVVEDRPVRLVTGNNRRRGRFVIDGRWTSLDYGDRIVIQFEAVTPELEVDPKPGDLTPPPGADR